MKLLLYGKNASLLTPLVTELGFTVVQENPEVVLSYGGDGTILAAEREFPGIAKLALRDSLVCLKCANHSDRTVLQALAEGKLTLVPHQKLAAQFHNQHVIALNDIVLRNQKPMHALRFYTQYNDHKMPKELVIGDGIVASTAFGSTGYYHSVTRTVLQENFAIGFSNSVIAHAPVSFSASDSIRIEIVRGPAELSYDNAETVFELAAGDRLEIFATNEFAQIYEAGTLRCSACKIDREKRLENIH